MHSPGSSSSTSSARTQADRRGAADVSPSAGSLLRRRDLALYPLLLIGLGSFTLALSHLLRPSGQSAYAISDELIAGGAFVFGMLVFAVAFTQARGIGPRLIGSLRVYIAAVALLLVGVGTLAVLDDGLRSISYVTVILVATYAGLVFPRRFSRPALAGLLALTAMVQLLRPTADLLEAGTIFALVVIGWLVGLLPRIGHQAAARQALLLSRGDALTGALNRRGFLEQFAWVLQTRKLGESLALLVIDLDRFKAINDREGHAAGDEILAWVGCTAARVLPTGAVFGRLGGDEFAVVLPGHDATTGRAVATGIASALSERIGASIGVATDASGDADAEAFLHAADRAVYLVKADGGGGVRLEPTVPIPTVADGEPVGPPALTYDRLRKAGGPPRSVDDAIFDGRLMVAGFTLVGLAGIPIVGDVLLHGGNAFFEEVLRYLGVPWIVANAAFAFFSRNTDGFVDPPRVQWWGAAVLVGGGVGAAALASGGGLTAPIMAAFALKILFDAATARERMTLESIAILGGFWIAVVALGPRDALWAAPYTAGALLCAHVLGSLGRHAFDDARRTRVQIGSTDALTGLLNRSGFEAAAANAIAAADAGNATLAVLTFDLDDFKRINDTQGHAAGDHLLRSVAHLTRDTLAGAHAIGRVGGDEFVALLPVDSAAVLHAQVADLDRGLAVIVGGSIGTALYGEDGTTYDELLAVADRRAYAVKQSRPDRHRARRQLHTGNGPDDGVDPAEAA